jgi:hypothetical protein
VFHRGFGRGRLAAQSFRVALLSGFVLPLGGTFVQAASSDYGGFTWTTDRADPAVFETLPTYQGRDDVLHIQTFPTTTVPGSSGFYQTEGRATVTSNPIGSSFVSGDIYLPSSWATSNGTDYVNIALWGVIGVPPTTDQSYPVIGFYNGQASDPAGEPTVQSGAPTDNVGEIRVYDSGRWIIASGANAVTSAGVIKYDDWNTFRLNYNAGSGPGDGSVDVVLNGTIIATLGCSTPGFQTCNDFTSIDPDTASLYSIILNSRTNGVSPYDVYWSNILASTREEYYDAASIAPTVIAAGDTLLGTYVDRRGLDWDGQKAAWMHAVGGVSSFDDGNGGVDSSVAGAQFGIDLVSLGDPSTRAGVTFGYASQSSSISLPSGIDGGDTSNTSPTVGAYITHASGSFYADLLGQYRFLDFNVDAPTSTGKVKGGSIDVAAEAGTHLAISDVFSLTPFVQVTYQHVMLDDTAFGGMPVSFGQSDALIARARILAEARNGAFSLFASAGVSGDLLDDKESTVALTTMASSIGGPRAEFTAGIEGRGANGFSIYGSGEYDISFDGNSHAYLGRAGIRKEF